MDLTTFAPKGFDFFMRFHSKLGNNNFSIFWEDIWPVYSPLRSDFLDLMHEIEKGGL